MPPGRPTLLWPGGRGHTAGSRLGEQAVADLHLDAIIRAMVGADAPAGRLVARERFARQVLTELLSAPEVIAHRQAVLADLLDNPALRERLEQVLPGLEALGDIPRGEHYKPLAEPGLERVARRLADLELLVDVVARLADALRAAPVQSEGFRSVGRELEELRRTPEFAALERELPGLRATLANVRSVTVGVNLGPDLAPESATILDLGTTPVEGRRALVWRLLGGRTGEQGLTPLQRGEGGPLGRPNELMRDLRHLLGQVVAPIHAALERFTRVSTDAVGQLGAELGLLLGAARLVERLRRAGLPVCRPDCLAMEERCTELVDAYDLELALGQLPNATGMVTNDVRFDARLGRVWVLTGPNRGGKTTYTRAVGLAQVLFQVGLYVPARSARLSPVDTIHTHFPGREETRPGLGRLDVEAEQLAAIFRQATPHSLILLNEALSGTSALEALDLARGLVRGLHLLGARAIYVTHLHELATGVDEINATTPGDGTVASLLADSVDDGSADAPAARRTYRILPRAPRGASFAAEIAEQHGISYAQLARLLHERHLA
jgi:DNA mismatch repair protein MutS